MNFILSPRDWRVSWVKIWHAFHLLNTSLIFLTAARHMCNDSDIPFFLSDRSLLCSPSFPGCHSDDYNRNRVVRLSSLSKTRLTRSGKNLLRKLRLTEVWSAKASRKGQEVCEVLEAVGKGAKYILKNWFDIYFNCFCNTRISRLGRRRLITNNHAINYCKSIILRHSDFNSYVLNDS